MTANLHRFAASERQRFLDTHPRSAALAARTASDWLDGVPMH